MRRSIVGIILALGCLAAPCTVEAQQPGKVHRIGILGSASITNEAFGLEALRQGLHELGYVEGQNLRLEYRSPEGKAERLADLAAELVGLQVEVLVAAGPPAVRAARYATTTLPIVIAAMGDPMGDPVEQGIVASQARPAGNITGSFFSAGGELQAKRLELLKEAVPGITRVALLLDAANPFYTQRFLAALEPVVQALGVTLQPVEVHGPDDLARAFGTIARGQAEALMVSDNPMLQMPAHTERIGDFVVAQRLPTIGGFRTSAGAGTLMAYGVNFTPLWSRAAVFIGKILHGARPGDLPMERVAEFELLIDLKVAQELGLTMSEALLLRADKVFPVSGVPLPDRLRIVPPDRRVAPELAAFAGKWFGTWEGSRTGEMILIVEAIDPPHAQVIRAWGNGTVGADTAQPRRVLSNWQRLRGQFVEGTLKVSLGGATVIYRLQPDGTLAMTVHARDGVSHMIMTRAPE